MGHQARRRGQEHSFEHLPTIYSVAGTVHIISPSSFEAGVRRVRRRMWKADAVGQEGQFLLGSRVLGCGNVS